MNRKHALCLILLAFLIILFPVYGLLLPQPSEDLLNENRELAEWPHEKDLRKQLKGVEEYLNDHLAYRDTMISSVLHMDLALGESPESMVILGRDGWLFYNEWDSDKDIRREITLSEENARVLSETQQTVWDELHQLGADYYVLIAPDKHSIYPEFLPISCRTGTGPSRLDQVISILEKTSVPVLDVREALLTVPRFDPTLYYRNDTHWNMEGAYIAYLEIMSRLQQKYPTLHIVTREEMQCKFADFSGDLAGMVGLANAYEDLYPYYSFPDSQVKKDKKSSFPSVTAYRNKACPDAPSVLIYSDSFGDAFIPFLKESVSTLYICDEDNIFLETVRQADPDIVLMERVERNVMWLESGIII